jgi:TonB family protein
MSAAILLPILSTAAALAGPGGAQGAFADEKVTQEGFVRARVDIDSDGRVKDCTIVESTAPAMNEATCNVLFRSARFRRPDSASAEDTSTIVRVVYRIVDTPPEKAAQQ